MKVIPDEINFDKNSKKCKGWVNAHFLLGLLEGESEDDSDKTYRTAKSILNSLTYVPFKDFKMNLNKLFKIFVNEVGEENINKFTLIIDKGKSSEWISNILEDYIDYFNINIVDADNMRSGYDGNYIRIDDAIYSGKQMCEYVKQFNIINVQSNLFILCPYQTHYGHKNIENCIKTCKNTCTNKIIFYKPIVYIDTFKEMVKKHKTLFDSDFLDCLENMYPNIDVLNMTNIFFQHKVPDQFSGISSFLRYGTIHDIHGNLIYTDIDGIQDIPSFQCVPQIVPPYKKEADYLTVKDRIKNENPKLYPHYKKKMKDIYELINQNQNLFIFGKIMKSKKRSKKRSRKRKNN